ncbi:MAG: ferritin-like domain-containing protein [Acidimicrobiia bacterium]
MVSALEDLKTPPPAAELEEEGLAAWEESFQRDKQIWGELLDENIDRLERGSYSLHWTDTTNSHWGTKVKPSSRGLTFNDINRSKAYGTIPDRADFRNLAPRGSVRAEHRDRMPVLADYTLLDKYELWADNVSTLYEEAKSRQWNSTRDIPWEDLEPVSEDLEKAACQFSTFLSEVEFVAGDFPARWIYRIPQDFFEVKNFLVTQMMDEARHMEVFRKRALAGGGGLLHASPAFEWSMKAILEAPTHTMGTYLLNLVGEGFVLSIFRAGEFLAKTNVDREIFRRCMQDEARHVAYGTMELKSYLESHPDPVVARENMHRFADLGEMVLYTSFVDPCLLEPIAVLMGGGIDKIDEGFEGIGFLWATLREEYLQRCDRAGFERRDRCVFPEYLPGLS